MNTIENYYFYKKNNLYSIQDLENLSGIKAHTIRIWEKRYQLLTPSRTDTNIRVYSDKDLKKLLNVSTLLHKGSKISKISKLRDDEITQQVDLHNDIKSTDNNIELFINNLISAGLAFDTTKFELTFASAIKQLGLKEMYFTVLLPTLIKIGLLWGKSQIIPAQEHLISNLIKQKLFASIDGLPIVSKPKQKHLLFLPPGEEHEVGLLLTNYLLKQNGHQVFYLGSNVPLENISISTQLCNPDSLIFFAVRSWTPNKLQLVIDEIVKVYNGVIYIFGSEEVIKSAKGRNIKKVSSIDDFNKILFV